MRTCFGTILAVTVGVGLGLYARAEKPDGNAMNVEAVSNERVAVSLLRAGKDTVRIVCFGDSITGVYYHTGSRRAYSDMVGVALRTMFPQAKVELINAGISGEDAAQGLARIERDVLAYKPRLVVVMFGMNDCIRVTPSVFKERLGLIVRRCREAGAEVVLCTPTACLPVGGRPVAPFAEAVRTVARELAVPLADCYQAFEAVRAADPLALSCLMSDAIHPNMNGHKLIAATIVEAVCGRRVDLADVPPFTPSLVFTFDRLARKQPVSVVAAPPYDELIPRLLRELYSDAVIDLTPWPVAGRTLGELAEWAGRIRALKPTLVAVAVPADAKAGDDEAYIRAYDAMLNASLAFAQQAWDTFVILPSVTDPLLDPAVRHGAELARRVTVGKDIGYLERAPGDSAPPEDLVRRWLENQRGEWTRYRQGEPIVPTVNLRPAN